MGGSSSHDRPAREVAASHAGASQRAMALARRQRCHLSPISPECLSIATLPSGHERHR